MLRWAIDWHDKNFESRRGEFDNALPMSENIHWWIKDFVVCRWSSWSFHSRRPFKYEWKMKNPKPSCSSNVSTTKESVRSTRSRAGPHLWEDGISADGMICSSIPWLEFGMVLAASSRILDSRSIDEESRSTELLKLSSVAELIQEQSCLGNSRRMRWRHEWLWVA